MMRVLLALLATVSVAKAETYFAHVNSDNVVDQVIVADPQYITSTFTARSSEWVQTYMTPIEGQPKNYAGIGYRWDAARQCFIAPEPPDQVGFDEATCQWLAPVARPK